MVNLKRIISFSFTLLFALCMFGCNKNTIVTNPSKPSSDQVTVTPSSTRAITPSETKHIHSYIAQIVGATCTEEGYMVHTCTCGHTFVDSHFAAAGHSWSQWETVKAPTETQEGLQKRICESCAAEDLLVLDKQEPVHSHAYLPMVVDPTCTKEGYTEYRCQCGAHYTDDTTQSLGHNWSDWQASDNCQTRTCSRCGLIDSIDITHTHSYAEEIIAATCSEPGICRFTCTCGHSYEEKISEPLGHTWGAWVVTEEPTTNSSGLRQRLCETCGEKECETIAALPVENGFVVVSFTETVQQNTKATVRIKGRPGVEYTITVYYKSGPASASGLEAAVADADGYVTWTWKVGGRTTPGTYEIVISGDGKTESIYFTVVAKD